MENAALSENSLAQEVVRRLLTTLEWVTKLERGRSCKADTMVTRLDVGNILEDFNIKMMRSGYSLTRRREIFKAGLLGYKRKMRRTMIETEGNRHRMGEEGLELGSLGKLPTRLGGLRRRVRAT